MDKFRLTMLVLAFVITMITHHTGALPYKTAIGKDNASLVEIDCSDQSQLDSVVHSKQGFRCKNEVYRQNIPAAGQSSASMKKRELRHRCPKGVCAPNKKHHKHGSAKSGNKHVSKSNPKSDNDCPRGTTLVSELGICA